MDFDAEKNIYKKLVKNSKADKIEVEIGDSKQPDFKPQFKVMRWDNEVNFSMRAVADVGTVTEKDGKIEYKTKDFDIHQYEVPIGEDGGFEFEWVLPKKPKSNVFTATIQTKELDFFYQPALTPEEIAEGASRPDNVVGSYAVYHKSKKNNTVGGKEYKTGKFCHIYRPEAIDANGDKTWCDLHIDEQAGLLTVTVPDQWLKDAVYPVKVDPTFGYITKGGTSSSSTPDTLDVITCFQHLISENGVINSISVYWLQSLTATPDFEYLIYRDSSNYPTSLLGTSTATWRLTAGWDNWKTLNFSSEPLPIGYFWLAYFADGSRGVDNRYTSYYDSIAPNNRVSSLDVVNWPTASDPFPPDKVPSNTLLFSVYATYTAALSLQTNTTTCGSTSATGNGNILTLPNGNATSRGFVWDTVPRNNPESTAPASSAYINYVNENGSFSTGAFTASLTGLTPSTIYYGRAYAYEATSGYWYGNEVKFQTTTPTAWLRA